MLSVQMVLAAIVVLGASGLPASLMAPGSTAGQRLTTLLVLVGSAIGLAGVALSFGAASPPSMHAPLGLPWGRFAVTIDAISALFLVPVFVVPALGSVYGLGYWRPAEHPGSSRRLDFSYGLLAGSMALVAIARDGVLFLIAWEIMALAAFFAATVEDDDPEVRRAGWVYLVATHVGTLCLIAMFALWRRATGSFALEPVGSLEKSGVIFVLAVIGFGVKAGLMPLHVWLPGAHANAPTHISAVMSGVMIKMGIYGIVRMTTLAPAAGIWPGSALLIAGAITGIAGIVFAIGQQDIKRLLAYSSIENVGIITMGIGLAMLGRSLGRPDWVVLGMGAALLHVWNHSVFKPLLFFGAGAVIHVAHTRDMDRLGGLARVMPRVTALFFAGAVAICALPPMNGFASEWLLFVGLFRTLAPAVGPGAPVAAMAAVALAMIGALAVACFVKLFGIVFLGTARSDSTRHAHDPSASMLVPMAVLAAAAACLGLLPMIAAPWLEDAAAAWARLPGATASITAVAPLPWITVLGLGLLVLATTIALILRSVPRAYGAGEADTWGCGYARQTTRMQYTGSSFAHMLVGLFPFILRPARQTPGVRGMFPAAGRFSSVVPDMILDRVVIPLFGVAGRHLPRLRVLQQGQTQIYALYILIVLIVLLVWGALGVHP